MGDRDIHTHLAEESGTFEVTPEESPSENYLVTEHLQRLPSIFSRGLVYLVLLILVATLVYSTLAKLDIVVECRAMARPASHKIIVLSDRSGYIEQIFISEGQAVHKNDPLFLIRSKEALTYHSKAKDLRESIPLKREYYNTKISSIQTELRQLISNHLANCTG